MVCAVCLSISEPLSQLNCLTYGPKIWWSEILRRHGTVDFVTSEHTPAQPVPYCWNFVLPCSERYLSISFWVPLAIMKHAVWDFAPTLNPIEWILMSTCIEKLSTFDYITAGSLPYHITFKGMMTMHEFEAMCKVLEVLLGENTDKEGTTWEGASMLRHFHYMMQLELGSM